MHNVVMKEVRKEVSRTKALGILTMRRLRGNSKRGKELSQYLLGTKLGFTIRLPIAFPIS